MTSFDLTQLFDAGSFGALAAILWRMGRFQTLVEYMEKRVSALEGNK